ncbi:MAG: Fe2+-dependent dioxygenase [Hydrogenophaga sp.]|uniref:Fe2+-dependent dioxygenase n=1 Tax=Hydrogenophaga sp. TaxID=1904254 RepID=UPI00272F1E0A|nr:Fe2+-dependent dioxygenase [Hydrogenophaga sp.]MDP2165801.1 Fe2+-dependent dioxygenase [Hydrogenophaga sp.]MDP3475275.1 Fe2+-dependent dioxygenase [Hydrogenophaga sp.]
MILVLKNLLNADELASIRADLGPQAPWISGASSAGGQAVTQKNNQQLAQDSAMAARLQQRILQAVQADPLFFSAALPRKVFNPLVNSYSGQANHYGPHIDGAILHSRQTGEHVRTDLSCTVFLSDPADYDGGELTVHDTYGAQSIKLPAGSAVLYPGTSLHEVRPVTRGQRLASFFWIQSMVRSGEQRHLLFDLDMNLLKLRQQHGETPETTALTGTYHNLLRMWADT